MSARDELQLGQRVRITNPLTRRSVPTRKVEFQSSIGGAPYTYTREINKEWVGNPFAKPAEGIVIGKRTLSNGHQAWESEGYGEGYWLNEPAEHFTAYLIAFDLRRKPVHVLPEHITAIKAAE